jgi:membrane-associated phospholipid phosphatase
VDRWVAERLHELVSDHPAVVDVLRAITALGRPQLLVLLGAAVAVVLVARRRVRPAVFVLVAVLGAWAVNVALKDLIGRERPVFDDALARSSGASFPSGHAMTSIAAYGAVVLLVRRDACTIAAAVLVFAIGVTRIVLGVHWTTDVLGGWLFGATWLVLCARVVLGPTWSTCDRSGPRL